MRVKLINVTKDARDLLIYTKNVRLGVGDDARKKVSLMTEEEKQAELAYMARTIPSSWEFVSFVFEITGVTRAFTHQLVRTRHASFAQQTMRMVDMTENIQVKRPDTIRKEGGSEPNLSIDDISNRNAWFTAINAINDAYRQLILGGVPIEDARGILPTNILTNIVMKIDLRNFVTIVQSRSGTRTQDEYRQCLDMMKQEVYKELPWVEQFIDTDRQKELANLESSLDQPDKHIAAKKIIDKLRKGEL